jgi:hypothetical protein
MFARSNKYWRIVSTSWGFTIGPYALIAAFLLLLLFWLTRTRVEMGYWTWRTPALEKVNLSRGKAPESLPQPEEKILWRKAIRELVEAI